MRFNDDDVAAAAAAAADDDDDDDDDDWTFAPKNCTFYELVERGDGNEE